MKIKKVVEVALGVVTGIGGFLDVGAIATAAEAGASFRYQLVWAIALGTLCVIILLEMAGRLALVSQHTLVDAIRERLGFRFLMIPLAAEMLIDFLVLAAEIGGVSIALQLITGIGFQWWAPFVGFVVWLLLWKGNFDLIENGIVLLGLVTLVFVFATFKLHPELTEVGKGFLPAIPREDFGHYYFIAVSILGAVISPYLFYFYSSGAVESKWKEEDISTNRLVATLGMAFGSIIAISVLIVCAEVLYPKGIQVDRYEQVAMVLTSSFGYWGFILFAASLGIACFGAALEVSLDYAYIIAQSFGWNWGENKKPKQAARFTTTYTILIIFSSLLMAIGIDPLQLTIFSMALTALMLPLVVLPFLILLNDESYVGKHRNNWLSNLGVVLIIGLTFVLAITAIPLEIMGG